MYLYVDETENEKYFIVAGLLVESESSILDVYKHFKKQVKNLPISNKDKSAVYTEFKSTLLDRKYQRIKMAMINELNEIEYKIIYSCYKKNTLKFNQSIKEKVYKKLIIKIVSSIKDFTHIYFDGFGIEDFESRIVKSLKELENVVDSAPADSQQCTPLQFIDNICSIIRHKKMNNNNNCYSLIENNLKEV